MPVYTSENAPKKPEEPEERWVTVTEAVGILKLSERTIRRYISIKRLSVKKIKKMQHVNISGFTPEIPEPPEPQTEIKRLEAEVTRLKSLLEEVSNDRDYLRQINAALLTNQQALIEATTTATETKTRNQWKWPWQKD